MHPELNPDLTPDPNDSGLRARILEQEQAVVERLDAACREFGAGAIALASSLGAEDMVLTDLIVGANLPIAIFSLDTGRLPNETHELMEELQRHYGLRLQLHYPERASVEDYVREHGIDGFRASIEARLACCRIRKVEPLRRALAGQRAWITGRRAGQSVTRAALPWREWDETHGLAKLNPLADWSAREVWAFIRIHGVPYNRLHDQGYPSIGCAPCTRAIAVGEDPRAGRWWWEAPETRECGLHPAHVTSTSTTGSTP